MYRSTQRFCSKHLRRIERLTSAPSSRVAATVDGPIGKSLADTSAIVLDGVPPYPVSVSLGTGTTDATIYGLGDVIRLAVTFDKSVSVLTVDGSSPPVLVLDCIREREALFGGEGDGTATLIFEYEVSIVPALCSNGWLEEADTPVHRLTLLGILVVMVRLRGVLYSPKPPLRVQLSPQR